jgi:ketosteroid isomerase-like protein
MRKRFSSVFLCLFCLTLNALAQTKSPTKKTSAGPAPDKAFMQKVWDGWATLDPANVTQYYATGPRTFFDIAPLKYNSWDEYQNGAKGLLAGFQSAKFTVNDDVTFHNEGNLIWATATVKEEITEKSGKVDMGVFRYTVIWTNENGKWLIVHEHVSAPIQ